RQTRAMLLAELNIRHTRRHMPTRRVAIGDRVLPTGHPGYGAMLLACITAAHVAGLDEEQAGALPALLRDARSGLSIPRRALRFRLQTDSEGLALSRHRLLGEDGQLVVEIDVHGQYPVPQLLGAVMAASAMAAYPRAMALRAITEAAEHPGRIPPRIEVRQIAEARARPPGATVPGSVGAMPWTAHGDDWEGIPTERRWAMEVLGFGPGASLGRDEVLRRFRRLVRMAHPDHGGASTGAAERIDELGEARRVLLDAG
ncbi:MAG: hypothetical protein ACRDY7_12090, partial [Acidimicrobiia bacterium]